MTDVSVCRRGGAGNDKVLLLAWRAVLWQCGGMVYPMSRVRKAVSTAWCLFTAPSLWVARLICRIAVCSLMPRMRPSPKPSFHSWSSAGIPARVK